SDNDPRSEAFSAIRSSGYLSTGKCSRAVSHLAILSSPSRLDAEGVTYITEVRYPGNFIITQQAQHHMVINVGSCMTQSVNFALTGDSLGRPNFIKCPIR
ncbi:hypothetical protein FocTR4_00001940, partial [Fusarium oxysporum f. sp. cubense]